MQVQYAPNTSEAVNHRKHLNVRHVPPPCATASPHRQPRPFVWTAAVQPARRRASVRAAAVGHLEAMGKMEMLSIQPTGDAFGTPNREGTYAPPSPIQSKAGKLIDWFQPLTTLLAVHWLSTQPRKDWQPQTLTSTYKPHSFPAQVLVGLCEPLLCWSSERVLRVGAVHPRRAMGSTTGGPSTLMTLMDHLSVKETYIHAMYPRTSKVSFSPTG